jgi:hypothetical protein
MDIFDIRPTSDEAKRKISIGEISNSIVEWQAIVGWAYIKASGYRKVTKKHEAWKKAAAVRRKVNQALKEQTNDKIHGP